MGWRYPASARDYRRLAQARLPRFLFDYIDGGASQEQTLRANADAWMRVGLRQRVLVDVAGVDTATTLAGQACAMPLALAPLGLAGMMARRGEVQAARAAEAAGVPFTLSTVGICPLAEIGPAVAQAPWFQLYMLRDRGIVQALLQQAWEAGCRVLVFTVDLPVAGMRHRDTRNGLGAGGLRARLLKAGDLLGHPRWLWDVGVRGKPHLFGNLGALLPGVRDLAAQGIVTGASGRNWAAYGAEVALPEGFGDAERALLTDPQTSGGLLVACAPESLRAVLDVFKAQGFGDAAVVGRVLPKGEKPLVVMALEHKATFWTQDVDHADLPGVRYFAKTGAT